MQVDKSMFQRLKNMGFKKQISDSPIKFQMLIFEHALVIKHYVQFAFIFVHTVFYWQFGRFHVEASWRPKLHRGLPIPSTGTALFSASHIYSKAVTLMLYMYLLLLVHCLMPQFCGVFSRVLNFMLSL